MHCIQHVPFEDMAGIEAWAKSKGHSTSTTLLFKGEELPLLGSFDWLVVMGGPMSSGDEAEYPWLKAEKRFIRSAVSTGKIVLGVCLGAQLLAEAMGGTVQKNRQREIGWYPVSLTEDVKGHPIFKMLPATFMAFHWHGDTFTLPPAARRLAFSEACDQQAFEIGRAIGLQFHLESTKDSIERLIENCGGDLIMGPYVQDITQIRDGFKNLAGINEDLVRLLDAIERTYLSGDH
jgi:GMP synthase-like glutamine amidotransferase